VAVVVLFEYNPGVRNYRRQDITTTRLSGAEKLRTTNDRWKQRQDTPDNDRRRTCYDVLPVAEQ